MSVWTVDTVMREGASFVVNWTVLCSLETTGKSFGEDRIGGYCATVMEIDIMRDDIMR